VYDWIAGPVSELAWDQTAWPEAFATGLGGNGGTTAFAAARLGARVRLVGPPTLVPGDADRWGCEVFHHMREGLAGADVVMMLRLQLERMEGALVPSTREYFRFWGLDREKLSWANPGARVMHPGPMNRGVEIDSEVADMEGRSLITRQVEMGVAIRMACLDILTRETRGVEGWA
jgi:aspartate carbamoyltransferase catalytic subunit